MKYPIRVLEQRLLPDTEGAGRRRGSPGAYVEYGPVGCEMDVVYLSDGTLNAPTGVRGGHDGSRAEQHRRAADGTLSDELGAYARVPLARGRDRSSRSAAAAAATAPPHEREPERVAADVREGLVTPERARDVYRVALDADGHPDAAETTRLRSAQ